MWPQIATIIWGQWRTVRNHLPRLGFASFLGNVLSLLWYLLVLSVAVGIAVGVPYLEASDVRRWLAAALLGIFVAWQVIPLFTLSTGWSLQLKKLQIYPIPTEAMFGIEVILRITASPELILILVGVTVGLLRHPNLGPFAPIAVLLLLPINLLLSLAIREVVLHSFERNRFREIFSVLLITIAVLPQALLRSGFGPRAEAYLLAASNLRYTPWNAAAVLALGRGRILDAVSIVVWTAAFYLLARWLFVRALSFEETPQAGSMAVAFGKDQALRERQSTGIVTRFLNDPLAALVQKDLQSLRRMPRFRVAFGMACIFSVLILFPMLMRTSASGPQFMNRNFLPMVSLYGMLILSDSLLLNIFGTDRSASALYFVAPVPFRTVLQAKNLTAVLLLAIQAVVAMLAAAAVRGSISVLDVVTALGAVAVVGLFFLSAGNMTSVRLPRPSDPRQTMRKAAGGKLQIWLLLCTLGMALLLGFAYLAQWALDAQWALFAVLAVEFAFGLIFYRVALDSAVEHAERDRESFVDALSKNVSLVGSGS